MNEPYVVEKVIVNEPSVIDEGIKNDTIISEGNLDHLGDRISADATALSETPMGGTVAAVRPGTESPIENVPVEAGVLVEIPMGGTVASAGPIDETIDPEFQKDVIIP